MVLVTVNFHTTCKLLYLSIDTNIQVSLASHLLKELTIMTFTVANKWRENIYLAVLIIRHNHIHHFFLGVFHHLFTAHIRVRFTCTSKEKAEVVVYLCSCTDSRARVFICCLLFNRDDRRESCNLIYLRTLHISKEVACVSREGFNIATLTFGKNSVESK